MTVVREDRGNRVRQWRAVRGGGRHCGCRGSGRMEVQEWRGAVTSQCHRGGARWGHVSVGTQEPEGA